MNLRDVIVNSVRRYAGKLALICGETRLTYREFNERCNRLANALLALGIVKGDHFALLSKNCHRHFEMFFCAAKTGTVFIPINYRLSPKEVTYIINDSGSRLLFFSKEFFSTVELIKKELYNVEAYICTDDIVEGMKSYENILLGANPSEPDCLDVHEDDLVTIIYTSGTTGYPKGAMISHRNRIADMIHEVIDSEYIESDDVHLNLGPLYHVGSLAQSHGHLYRGCTVVVHKEFIPKQVFETIERENIRTFWAAPTMLKMLTDSPEKSKYNLKSIKTITYAGSPMPVPTMEGVVSLFGPNKLIQFFGSTETGPTITHLTRADHVFTGTEAQMKKLRSVGVEDQNVHARIVDGQDKDVAPGEIGEIVVKSDAVCKGYWNRPDETQVAFRNGWFHTGDLGYVDEDLYFYVVDRKKDMIISGGENIYSAEVENVLYLHPAISEAAVIGVPDEKWGETVKAVVVLKPSCHTTEDEIIRFCKKNLASYKKPTSVMFVSKMPKNHMGKISKKELRTLT